MRKFAALILPVCLVVAAAVLAADTPAATGKVKLDAKNASLGITQNDKDVIAVSSDGGEMSVPAGTYKPKTLTLSKKQVMEMGGEKSEMKWEISSRGPWGKLAAVEVVADQTTSVTLGEPLTLTADAKQSGDSVNFGCSIIGSAGETYQGYAAMDGKPVMKPPKITVLDEAGKVLDTGSFQFG